MFRSLDHNIFQSELKKRSVKNPCKKVVDNGLSKVLIALINQYDISQIDFDSFTFDDVERAIEEVQMYNTDEDFDFMEDACNKGNALHEIINIESVTSTLLHTNKKAYEVNDDFI